MTKKIQLSYEWMYFIKWFHQDCFYPEHLGIDYHMNRIWELFTGVEQYLMVIKEELEKIENGKYTNEEIRQLAVRHYFSIWTPDLKAFFIYVLQTLRTYLKEHPEIEQKYGKGRPKSAGDA